MRDRAYVLLEDNGWWSEQLAVLGYMIKLLRGGQACLFELEFPGLEFMFYLFHSRGYQG